MRLRTVVDRARDEGVGVVARQAWTVLRDTLAPPWHVVYWARTDGTPDSMREGLSLERVTENLDGLGARVRQTLDRDLSSRAMRLYLSRLERGASLFVLTLADDVAGVMFTVPGSRQPFQHVLLTRHDAMVLDARVWPAHRGKGLYRLFLSGVLQRLKADGIERLYIDTPETNVRSIRTFDQLGFEFLVKYRSRSRTYRYDASPL